jgi:hypothetical protein
MTTNLPDEIRTAMDNGIPIALATCSADGTPNASIVSRVYYVDAEHVALSFQFFNKTIRNVRENPRAEVHIYDFFNTADCWILAIEYDHSETDGPIFDAMDAEIEAIASATGMSGIFKLKSSDIYRVLSVERIRR